MAPGLAKLFLVLPLLLLACESPEKQLEKAEALRLAGDPEGAAEAYARAAASDLPEVGGVALLGHAEVSVEAGDPARAEELCHDTVARFPSTSPAGDCLRLRARLRILDDDPWGAIEALKLFLEHRPDDPACEEVRFQVAQRYLDLADPAQARLEWNALLEAFPDGRLAADARLGVARSHDVAGDCPLAVPAYRRVANEHPNTPQSAEAMVGEAGCLEAAGELEAAERLYRRAQPLHPNPAMVLQRLEGLERSRWVRDPPQN